jgi:acyl carrier protein
MSQDELNARVAQVVARVARIDASAIALDKDLYREIGVKSAAALDLLLSLEEEFGISIPDQQFGDARTLASLADLVGGLAPGGAA